MPMVSLWLLPCTDKLHAEISYFRVQSCGNGLTRKSRWTWVGLFTMCYQCLTMFRMISNKSVGYYSIFLKGSTFQKPILAKSDFLWICHCWGPPVFNWLLSDWIIRWSFLKWSWVILFCVNCCLEKRAGFDQLFYPTTRRLYLSVYLRSTYHSFIRRIKDTQLL